MRNALSVRRSTTGADLPRLGALDADDLEPVPRPLGAHRLAVERRALPAPRREVLVGAEVVDEAELDVGHRRARRDGDADAVDGDRAARVERAVDRVDHDPAGAAGSPNATSPRSSETAVNSTPSACTRSSSAKTTSSQRRSISSVRSPPSPTRPRRRCARRCPRPRRGSRAGRRRHRRQTASQSTESRSPAMARDAIRAVAAPRGACPRVALALDAMAEPGDSDDPALDGEQEPGRRASRRAAGRHAGRRARARARRSPRRIAARAAAGDEPERTLVFTRTPAAASWLRRRVETLLEVPFEELWIGTYATLCERLLREHATDAGLDPFFETVGAADRLAILLERIDELPLRRQEIRGNPAGLLARLLERIDALKGGGGQPRGPSRLGDGPRARRGGRRRPRAARRRAARDRVRRALRAPRRDRARRGQPRLDRPRQRAQRPRRAPRRRARAARPSASREVIADELEDAGPPQQRLLEALAAEHGNLVVACDELQAIRPLGGPGSLGAFLDRHGDAERDRARRDRGAAGAGSPAPPRR